MKLIEDKIPNMTAKILLMNEGIIPIHEYPTISHRAITYTGGNIVELKNNNGIFLTTMVVGDSIESIPNGISITIPPSAKNDAISFNVEPISYTMVKANTLYAIEKKVGKLLLLNYYCGLSRGMMDKIIQYYVENYRIFFDRPTEVITLSNQMWNEKRAENQNSEIVSTGE